MKRRAGPDIGSRTVKLAVVENNEIVFSKVLPTSHDPVAVCRELLSLAPHDALVATGYGRHLAKEYFGCPVVSEIKAFASGAAFISPRCRTVLDIGGQDTKAVSLNENGKLDRFEMNDKCAAGTGRFLEIMASALGYSMSDFISAASAAKDEQSINTTCTVFAESEVISLVNRGVSRDAIARGIHRSVAARAVSLLQRVSVRKDVLFAGGVANNACVRTLVEEALGLSILIPENPQIIGAIGSALSSD